MTARERLREARVAAGMSQQALAAAAGLSISLVTKLESGATGVEGMSAAALFRVADALGVTPQYIIGDAYKQDR